MMRLALASDAAPRKRGAFLGGSTIAQRAKRKKKNRRKKKVRAQIRVRAIPVFLPGRTTESSVDHSDKGARGSCRGSTLGWPELDSVVVGARTQRADKVRP